MTCTQQQLDDVLESLIALTEGADLSMRCSLLASLCLTLAAQVDDAERLQAAIACAASAAGRSLNPELP